MAITPIHLDWARLLGFDHCRGDAQQKMPVNIAKVGDKNPPGVCVQPSELSRGLSAKVGAKQMLRRAGELDSVALSRLTKVGLKEK